MQLAKASKGADMPVPFDKPLASSMRFPRRAWQGRWARKDSAEDFLERSGRSCAGRYSEQSSSMESVSSLAREAIFRPGLIQRVDAGSSKSTVMTGMPCLFLVLVIGGDWRWKISIGKLDD